MKPLVDLRVVVIALTAGGPFVQHAFPWRCCCWHLGAPAPGYCQHFCCLCALLHVSATCCVPCRTHSANTCIRSSSASLTMWRRSGKGLLSITSSSACHLQAEQAAALDFNMAVRLCCVLWSCSMQFWSVVEHPCCCAKVAGSPSVPSAVAARQWCRHQVYQKLPCVSLLLQGV